MGTKLAPFILVVDEDREFAQAVMRHFTGENLNVICVSSLREADRILADHFVSLIMLNTCVQGCPTVEFLEWLRSRGQRASTIFVADRQSQSDWPRILEIGDDIIQKPVSLKELVARTRAVLRRANAVQDWCHAKSVIPKGKTFQFCGATVHPNGLAVHFPDGSAVSAGKKEIGLMTLFAGARGIILPRKNIIHRVWGLHANVRSRSLDQYIARVRRLFCRNGCKGIGALKTVHGVGYIYLKGDDNFLGREKTPQK
ncbi:MAG: response regulator transcription factor [Puniceicoccales bacterium]|jgi:two-component system alkaline phosphatase synthesis response regulator PhoP|nr:response regulator transcription factor [Puniceicoccales bacterium]